MDNVLVWQASGDYTDIRYETLDGIAKITIDRPEVRNAFRPQTIMELSQALEWYRRATAVDPDDSTRELLPTEIGMSEVFTSSVAILT